MKDMTGGTQVPVWHKVRALHHGVSGHRDLQPVPARTRYSVRQPVTLRSRLATAVSNPDFVAITIFCAIGLLAMVNLILRIPELGVM